MENAFAFFPNNRALNVVPFLILQP